MKTTGYNIATIFDAKFPGKLDDTLINRLCLSVVCQHEFHTEFWSTLPISEWHLISKHASRWDIDCDYTTELHIILKAAVSLSFRYGFIFGNEDFGPHQIVLYALNVSNKNVDITLTEALANCLKSLRSLTDISSVSWIKSPKVLTLLQGLSRETNVHVFRNTVIICAFIFLHLLVDDKLDASQKPFNECFQLSAFGTEVLFLIAELIKKFNIEFDTLQIPDTFQFSVTTFDSFPSELQAKLLFLVFTRIVSSPSTNSDWVSYLKSLRNFPELCASIISFCLKSNKELCNEMWKFVIDEWSISLHTCLENDEVDSLLRIINPVCLYTNASLHMESGNDLLKKILSVVMKNSNSVKGNKVDKYHARLWVLSRILVHCSPSSIVSLSDVTDVADYLVSCCSNSFSNPMTSSIDAAFNFFEEVCLLYWSSKQSVIDKLIFKLFGSLLTTDNPRIFSTFSFHFIHLIEELSYKYNCLEVYSTFWICLFKLLNKVNDQILNQSPMFDVFNNEGLLDVAVAILKILSRETYILLWTGECKLLFSMFVDSLMSRLGVGNFINDASFRGLSLSTFIIFIVCEYHNNHTSPHSKDQNRSLEWAYRSYDYLVNFDLMELTESKCVSKTLWNTVKYLEKESEEYPIDLWKNILSSITMKWKTDLGEEYFLSIQELPLLNYCPNCKENIEELLDDIIISSTSNMTADCTEG
ncbi:unnamed protein product [Schistosoma mattheei]|uniref:Methyl methanesulfonate-sensitivity protein 22-like n=1 Tax=Schistosoma mattheei TaxID=31246 RepID=A0AA85BUC6_9TREM|nr:unnamed protein product [Schistosoma mattheei]